MSNENNLNEEVMEEVLENEPKKTGRTFNKVAGVGFGLLACGLLYKYVAKPILTKNKSNSNFSECVETEDDEFVEDYIYDDDNEKN